MSGSNSEGILVIDDTIAHLDHLRSVLESEGYGTFIAKTAHAGLQVAQRSSPDLILLDVMLPDMDGFAVCRHLKESDWGREIPVVFTTANTDVDSIVRGFEVGGADYITKPIRELEVIARVRTQLAVKQLTQSLRRKNSELEATAAQLRGALSQVKTLSGLLPICSNCKKIRDGQGVWQHLEIYLAHRSDAKFTHGLCPACIEELYGAEMLRNVLGRGE